MDNLEYVKAITEPAINIMKSRNILASFTISVALYNLNSVSGEDAKVLFNAKNIMKKKAGKKYNSDIVILEDVKGVRFKKYDSFEECIEDWLLTFRSSLIKGVWDFDSLIRKLEVKEYTKANLGPYIDAYMLDRIDAEVLEEMYPSNQSIIEVPATSESDADIFMRQFPFNLSNGGHEYDPHKAVIKTPVSAPIEKKPIQFIKGEKVCVKNINIFKDPAANIASRSFTGNMWLFNEIEINGRYAIVTNKEYLNKSRDYIDGYVKKSDII